MMLKNYLEVESCILYKILERDSTIVAQHSWNEHENLTTGRYVGNMRFMTQYTPTHRAKDRSIELDRQMKVQYMKNFISFSSITAIVWGLASQNNQKINRGK